MADVRLLLPLLIGHESEMLDTLTPNGQTQFRWTVSVRSAGQLQFTDRSFITKVIFELHPDFTNRKRVVKEPPFEVTETGYAGFIIPIFISFAGISKPYKLMYDMNLVIEKQSKHSVEQMILIRPPNESFDLFIKYGARVKGEKKKKDKHRCDRDEEDKEGLPERNEMIEGKQSKRKKKNYLDEFKMETPKETPIIIDRRPPVPTTSSAISKKFTPRKAPKPFNDEPEKEEKPKPSSSSSRLTPPSDRSRGSANGRSSPAIERLKNSGVAKASPANDRQKNAANGRLTPPLQRPKSSNRSSPLPERAKSSSKEKLTPPIERPRSSASGKLVSPSESSKNSDDQSPPAKKRKQEISLDTLLAVQKSLMDVSDAEKMLAIVDTIFSSSQWPVPSLEYSEDAKLLSFDLFSLDPAVISKLEELCR